MDYAIAALNVSLYHFSFVYHHASIACGDLKGSAVDGLCRLQLYSVLGFNFA